MTQSPQDASPEVDVQPPAWFTAFQVEMGRLLRTPLNTNHGRFRADVESYPRALVADVQNDAPGASARLELYHEQYWRRLFNTLQEAFSRTSRVMGYFGFNGLASRFLDEHPPTSFDLANVTEGFFSWTMHGLDELCPPGKTEAAQGGYRLIETPLRAIPQSAARSSAVGALGAVAAPWSLVAQALHVDEAERRAVRAIWEPLWNPTVQERARLFEMRPRYAPSFSLLRLDYYLPLGKLPDDAEFVPERRKTPAHVVLVRSSRGIATYPIDPIFARLLALARVCRLGEAQIRTEKALNEALREHLRRSSDAYIDSALKYGFWIGADA